MQVGSIIWIAVDKLEANSYNPNVMSAEKFEALCDFLRGHKAEEVDPIWVRNDGVDDLNLPLYEIIDGEHRWKAAKAVGWKRLRAFVLPIKEDEAKSFNVRKNRERGHLDAFKFGKIISEEYAKHMDIKDSHERDKVVGSKFGLKERQTRDYRCIYDHREEILTSLKASGHISAQVPLNKAVKVLRELKREEGGEPEPDQESEEKSEEIVEEMVEQYLPAIEKAYSEVKPYNKKDPERNKLVLNMLLKNLREGLVFCPICGKGMMECSSCHTALDKMKEDAKL